VTPLPPGLAAHFSRFLGAVPGRLHVAAHSHHPWPDVTFGAHQRAWLDAARLMDDKWDEVFGVVLPEAAGHIAGRLGLSDPEAVAFAPSTHALVMRLLSCLPGPGAPPATPSSVRILTTDAEFHSFARQAARLEEDGLAVVERVPAEPFATFPDRFAAAAGRGGHDLVYCSHVFFNSGYVVPDLAALVAAVPDPEALVVIDGYHGFMAVPTALAAVEHRAFYLAGGYKYAMAGEGACFAHCPPGYAERPRDTGWFAGFTGLSGGPAGEVAYAPGGGRMLGATLDPTGVYRFNAVQRWLDDLGVTVADIHTHVGRLQQRFLDAGPHPELLPGPGAGDRGHFLTFRLPDAAAVHRTLHARGVITDHRDDRLRIGFGLYHDDADVDELARRLEGVPGWPQTDSEVRT
jgi:selenocysteine lyase/cysteine desulfurase